MKEDVKAELLAGLIEMFGEDALEAIGAVVKKDLGEGIEEKSGKFPAYSVIALAEDNKLITHERAEELRAEEYRESKQGEQRD